MVGRLKRAWQWWYRTDWAIGLTIFLVALLPRMIPSGMFMDPDSALQWIPRTRGFLEALSGGDPAGFAPDIHPGVPLMWLTIGGLGLWHMIGPWFTGMDHVEAFAWVVKAPVAVMTSLLVLMGWRYLRQAINRPVAVLVSLLLALDPLFLVYSRYLHLDALVTGFVFTGLIAVWVGLTKNRQREMVGGAILLALGCLTRFNALPAVGVALGYIIFRGRFVGRLRPVLLFLGAGVVTIVIVWPAILFSPERILDLVNNRIGLALVPHEVPPNVDVIPWVRALLYPIFLLTREFPLIVLGALIGLTTLWSGRQSEHHLGRMLVVFSIVYYAGLIALPKDLDRYALPIVAPLVFVAALGWRLVWRQARWTYVRVGLCLVGLLQLVLFYTLSPYFQTYQNIFTPLFRKTPLRTSQALDPSWGEGMAEAMSYINTGRSVLPPTAMWFAGIGCFYGHPHDADHYPINGTTKDICPPGLRILGSPTGVDYLVLSRDQIAQRIYPGLLDDIKRLGWQPEYVVVINGKPMVFIYRNLGGLAETYSLTGG